MQKNKHVVAVERKVTEGEESLAYLERKGGGGTGSKKVWRRKKNKEKLRGRRDRERGSVD